MDELLSELRKGAEHGAKSLLGWELVHETTDGIASGYIVETEAYHQDDPASHTHKGQTKRNSAMFGEAGTVYVYFTYGMHYCVNIVSGEAGVGEGILIRALKPVQGVELMKQRRSTTVERLLTNGPAKLVQALAIGPEQNNTAINTGSLHLRPGRQIPPHMITTGPRIGISKAVHELKRFYIKDNPFVSHYKG